MVKQENESRRLEDSFSRAWGSFSHWTAAAGILKNITSAETDKIPGKREVFQLLVVAAVLSQLVQLPLEMLYPQQRFVGSHRARSSGGLPASPSQG